MLINYIWNKGNDKMNSEKKANNDNLENLLLKIDLFEAEKSIPIISSKSAKKYILKYLIIDDEDDLADDK